MRVTSIVEKDGGLYEFTANLSTEQHQFLLEYAIQSLITQGLMPFNPDREANSPQIQLTDDKSQH